MKHLPAAIASIVLAAASVHAAAPVHAQQQTPPVPTSAAPTPPSATATIEELAHIRARLLALQEAINQREVPPGGMTSLYEAKEERARLLEQMRRFSAQTTPVTVRVPIDPRLVEVSNRMSPDFGPEPMKGMVRRTFINHFADTVETDLSTRGSRAGITVDLPIAMLTITGPQWEVEEAKAAMQDALPGYLQRVLELEAIEAGSRDSQRNLREREQFIQLERSTVNIDWEGGALRDLVKAVRSTVECNVVLAEPSVGTLVIPALSVNRVAPEVFFQSLQSIPLAEGRQLSVSVIAPEPRATDGNSPTLVETRPVIVIAEKLSANPIDRPASMTQRIFDLGDWPGAEGAGMKGLIEAIDFAMQANGTAEQMKVRYHEPSRILFAKGPSDSIRLVGEIVDAIRNQK
jgi:hypothetical protein